MSQSQLNLFAALSNPGRVNINKAVVPPTMPTLPEEEGSSAAFFSEAQQEDSFAPDAPDEDPVPQQEFNQRAALEKQALLHELRRLEMAGTQLTKAFTMADSTDAMDFELERHRVASDTASSVNFMSDALKLGCQGLEMMNEKVGQLLHLDGWSAELTRDMGRFKGPLQRIYKRVFRRGSPSPFLELGFLIFGSMAMHHMRGKSVDPNVPAATAKMPSIPFDFPRPARQTAPPMRRPPVVVPQGPRVPTSGPPTRRTMVAPGAALSLLVTAGVLVARRAFLCS